MPNDSFSWLHLTDFHYGLDGQDCRWPTLREPFFEDLRELHKRCGPWQAVFFTGDLVQSGASAQFSKMQAEVLDPLWKELTELGSGNALLLAVPGNHDLQRPNPKLDEPAMHILLQPNGYDGIETKFWQPSSSYRLAIDAVFDEYSKWWKGVQRRPTLLKSGALPGDFSATIEHGNRRIGIIGLNTTFLQLAEGIYEGRLVWDPRQLHAVCEGGVDVWTKQHDVCLLLTHQGPDWLTPDARKLGETEIAPAGRFAVHLFGHQHTAEITYIRRASGKRAVRLCQACSLFGLEKYGNPPQTLRSHGYTAGRIEFGARQISLRIWPRIATDKAGRWRYVPDHDHVEDLKKDGGTLPELLAVVPSRMKAPSAKSAAVGRPAAAKITPVSGAFVPHSTLPARRQFFGRRPDSEKIARYLLPADRSWGVVLDGPGGVGKTSLALEAAHQAPAEHFPLKLWITAKSRELRPDGEQELKDYWVGDYYSLLTELGLALGRDDISRATPEERPVLVRHALGNHQALLVLDNLEAFSAEERRRLFELLGNLPAGCRAIVTSRRRTDGSSAAHSIRLDKLEREAADELLVELGQRYAPVARLSSKERDDLYVETGGNPLLLTWTASQLGRTTGRCPTVAEAIQRLQEAHRLEGLSQRNDPLEFIFGDLVETLTDSETKVLSALVHFTQPARITWLQPITKLSKKGAEAALDGLRDRSLLVEDDIAGTWWLPPLAARFLRRTRPGAVGESGDRLGDWAYAHAAQNGDLKQQRYHWLEEAWPQLAAAFPVLIADPNNNRLQDFFENLVYFLDLSARWDEILLLATAAETKANNNRDFVNALRRILWGGTIYYRRAQAVELKACVDRAADYVKKGDLNAPEQALSIRLRGNWLELVGDLDAALKNYREMVKLLRHALPESRALCTGLGQTAVCLRQLGQFDEAEIHSNDALAIAKKNGDDENIAVSIGILAVLALDREQWDEAELLAREALDIAEGIDDLKTVAVQSRSLAEALARQGRGAEGLPYAEYAVTTLFGLRSKELAKAQATLDACRG